jgi:hypothetical protein
MSIEVNTADSTCWVKRLSNLIDYDNVYTITLRLYLPAQAASDTVWGMSGVTTSTSGTRLGTYSDGARFRSGGDFEALAYDGTNFINPVGSGPTTSGWHSIAILNTGSTTRKIRVNGTNYTCTNASFVGREASYVEFLFSRGANGEACAAGTRITNFKVWTAALSDGDIDAEMLTTSVVRSTDFWSQSPMGDENTLSNNLTQIGSGSSWTAGAGMVAGLNDPGVDYGPGGGGGGVPKSNKFFLMGIG